MDNLKLFTCLLCDCGGIFVYGPRVDLPFPTPDNCSTCGQDLLIFEGEVNDYEPTVGFKFDRIETSLIDPTLN